MATEEPQELVDGWLASAEYKIADKALGATLAAVKVALGTGDVAYVAAMGVARSAAYSMYSRTRTRWMTERKDAA